MGSHMLRRLGAAAALVLYAGVVILILRLIVASPGVALALGPTAAVLLYAAWLIFTGSGARKRNGLALLGAGIVAALVILVVFFREVDQRRLALGVLAVGGLYAGCVALLRAAYWRERRKVGRSAPAAEFKRPYLIINPRSGNGRAMKAEIDRLAKSQGINTIVLQPGDTVQGAAMRAVQNGADVLGISGGDGSIGAVAKIALEHEIPMVVLPGGTRCHFARDLGLLPEKIVNSLDAFKGVERRIDAGSINGRIFLNNVSFGLYADIVDHPEYREHKLAVGRKVLSEIMDGTKRPYTLHFRHGAKEFHDAIQIVVAVNRYQMFSIFDPTRRQQLDGGILQISVVGKLNDALIRGLLRSANTERLLEQSDATGFYQWENQRFTVTGPNGTLRVGVDGENEAFENPVVVRVLPKALRIYVPAEGVRSRPVRVFSPAMLRYLWREAVRGNPEPAHR